MARTAPLYLIICVLASLLIISCTMTAMVLNRDAGLITQLNKPITNISPTPVINESQIKVYDDYYRIDIANVSWFSVQPTGSMLPLLNHGNYGFGIPISSETSLHIGDVVVYKNNNDSIIHRIVNIQQDENGTYYTLKGDNNHLPDITKVKFKDIEYKLIGIVY